MSERVLGIEHPNTIQEYVSVYIHFNTTLLKLKNAVSFLMKQMMTLAKTNQLTIVDGTAPLPHVFLHD